ncbi:MAG TPA: hypothetical protein VHM91_25640 [Verrucomicrobiales bacterium]|jgi:hypothetical protein|nr:hypothetical protein [Verrucomicrobiales bacterium]
MIKHWHIKVTTADDPATPVADWLVEAPGEPSASDLQKAADHLGVKGKGPLEFQKRLMNHTGEYPGPIACEIPGLTVWVFPPPSKG